MPLSTHLLFFFFNDTATTEIYTLSLHDALPISHRLEAIAQVPGFDLLRERGRSIKHQVMDHLDFYLEQFSTNVEARGGKVHWAATGEEACAIIDRKSVV